MYLIDAIAIALIIFSAVHGCYRGSFYSGLGVVRLVLGYAAAVVLYQPCGQMLMKFGHWQPLLAYPVGAVLAFLLAALFFAFILIGIRSLRRSSMEPVGTLRRLDRTAGGIFGAITGILTALVLTISLLFVQALKPDFFGNIEDSITGEIASPLAKQFSYAVTEQLSGSQMIARQFSQAVAKPNTVARSLQTITTHPNLRQLLQNEESARALVRGDEEKLRTDENMRAIIADKKFITAAADVGLLDGPAQKMNSNEIQRQLSAQLLWPLQITAGLLNDPEVLKLLSDRELQKKLQERDYLSLLNDPNFNQLAMRVRLQLTKLPAQVKTISPEASSSSASAPVSEGPPEKSAPKKTKKNKLAVDYADHDATMALPKLGPKRVFKWTDKQGNVHMSDSPPSKKIKFQVIDMQ